MNQNKENVHASAVAVGCCGLLLLGESGSGKSTLAARMIADWPFGKVRLVADDRVLLQRHGEAIVARPHAAISGSLEIRGEGIVRPPTLEAVVIRAILKLSPVYPNRLPEVSERQSSLLGLTLPLVIVPTGDAAYQRMITFWPYLRGQLDVK